MNLGIIVPQKPGNAKVYGIWHIPIFCYRIEVVENMNLVICNIPLTVGNAMLVAKYMRRVKGRLDKLLMKEGVMAVLEHPSFTKLYGSHKANYDIYLKDIAVYRLPELIKVVKGTGDLSHIEVTLTGGSRNLEYAISKLITSVRCINILLPEGISESQEAELAFAETGIPVHITTDPEVLNRTALWIRFPSDHESFDCLPSHYSGRIIDLGELKVIDTRTKRIYNICLELADRIVTQIGFDLCDELGINRLSGFVTAYCSNAWEKSPAEVSIRLGMRLSIKP